MVNAIILDPFTLKNIAANSFRINDIQHKFDSLKRILLENYEKMLKFKNTYKKGYNMIKMNYKNKDNYLENSKNLQKLFSLINSDNEKENYNFNDNSKIDLNLTKKEGKFVNLISFEEYEKNMDIFNNYFTPNFIEQSIK